VRVGAAIVHLYRIPRGIDSAADHTYGSSIRNCMDEGGSFRHVAERGGSTMPMCDAYIPEGALPPAAERELLSKVTDLLLLHEGVDPSNPAARALAWVFVHRHDMYVAGAPAGAPHYKFVCQVPEGQYDEERRAAVTKAMTEALAQAEGGRWPSPQARVWVFTFEVPDGTWGGLGGRVVTLPDIAAHVIGDAGRRYGEQRLAERRREQARALLESAQGPTNA
jgi:phenylpyruvate tautomerase PptA (4-oxalocrotonate tautomerase family)